MFAPKTAKPQAKTSADSSSLVRPRSTLTAQRHSPAEQALLLQRAIGNQATLSALSVPSIMQPKLVIGEVNDPLEHEADRIADQVMRMPAPVRADGGATLQPQCAACEEAEPSETLQAKRHDSRESSNTEASPIVNEVLRSAGEPLDASARAFFEPRFGRDFSQVRVHVGDRAAESVQSIEALAYTVGPHIAFASGRYAPGSDHGRRLLAHELVHTVQQGHSRIQQHPDTIHQGEVGLVYNPEEFEDKESGPTEVAWLV